MTELAVEVFYARADRQCLAQVRVPAGSTLRDAIVASGLPDRFPEIDLAVMAVGIWGRLRSADEPVAMGDRVEIYRPLACDPKDARRGRTRPRGRR